MAKKIVNDELTRMVKKINQRMKRMEESAGTEFDLTKSREYRDLQRLAEKENFGAKKRKKTAGNRLKERGLDKLSEDELKELKKELEKAEIVTRNRKEIRKKALETQRRLAQGGVFLDINDVMDYQEAARGTAMGRLEQYYPSKQNIAIMKMANWDDTLVNKMLDYYLTYKAGHTFNREEFLKFIETGKLRGKKIF